MDPRLTSHRSKVAWTANLAAAVLLVCAAASADSRAEQLFAEGREEMKAGRYAEACEKFSRSYELHAGNAALLNLAICEHALGQLARAWTHLRASLERLSSDDPRYAIAEEHFRAVGQRVAMLTVATRKQPAHSVEVRLDGRRMIESEIGVPIPIDPGSHELLLIPKAGAVERVVFAVKEGERITQRIGADSATPGVRESSASLEHSPRPSASATGKASGRNPAIGAESQDSTRRTWGYTLSAGGVAALATAGVMGVMIQNRQEIVREHCPNKRCDDEGYEAGAEGRKLVTGAIVATAVGTVAVGVGVYLIATDKSSAATGGGPSRLALEPAGGMRRSEAQGKRRPRWHVALRAMARPDGGRIEMWGAF